jgi:SHS2 domain-containing protein
MGTGTDMAAEPGELPTEASGFALLDHTADVGVTAVGPDPAIAFAAAAHGMFTIMLGEDVDIHTGPTVDRAVSVGGETWEDLLVNWLAELVYLYSVEGLVGLHYVFSVCDPPNCTATATGILFDGTEAEVVTEIKAVTYHQILVDIKAEQTRVQVIFDV